MRISFSIVIIIIFSLRAFAQPNANQWVWMGGSNGVDVLSNYGSTKGVELSTNDPGARQSSACWVDKNGYLWVMGGLDNVPSNFSFFLDLYRYTLRHMEVQLCH